MKFIVQIVLFHLTSQPSAMRKALIKFIRKYTFQLIHG